eukprot:TRINITY_DN27329_c0_g1_i1.p1 TRINITY_DN27329_c0_g1~~TRINITY_DN27329_c0_g1_i1.p1  ORF type:complete len:827 (+),score=109.31 TRINITY_DN27329_c0_g1_i1:76-2556(+)
MSKPAAAAATAARRSLPPAAEKYLKGNRPRPLKVEKLHAEQRSVEEIYEKVNSLDKLQQWQESQVIVRRAETDGTKRKTAPPGIMIMQEGELAGRTVITPPLSVMPPRATLGYRGETRANPRDVALFYSFRTNEPLRGAGPRSGSEFVAPDSDSRGSIKDVLAWEAENGLLANVHPRRQRWGGVVDNFKDACANEVAPSGNLYMERPMTAVSRRTPSASLKGAEWDDKLGVWAARGDGDCEESHSETSAPPAADGVQGRKRLDRRSVQYQLPAELRQFLTGGGDAATAAANAEAFPYVELRVTKESLTHERMIQWLCFRLKLQPTDFGLQTIADAGHRTTQPVFLLTETAAACIDALQGMLGPWELEGCDLEVSISAAALKRLPSHADAKLVTWTTVRDVIGSPDRLHTALSFWIDRKALFCNFFPPAAFNAHRCRAVPLWTIGWHVYRMDDLHVAYAVLAHELYVSAYKSIHILLVPFEKWHRTPAVRELLDHLERSQKRNSGNHYVLRAVVRYIAREKGVKNLTRHLLNTQREYVGECLAAFHKFAWNFIVSGRLRYSKTRIANDLVVDPEYPHDPYIDTLDNVHYTRRARDLGITSATATVLNGEHGTRGMNIVFPFAHLFSQAPPGPEAMWPDHKFSQSLVGQFLKTFGLTHSDTKALSDYLPPSVTRQKYRPIVVSAQHVDYVLRDTPFPEQRPDAEADEGTVPLAGRGETIDFRYPPAVVSEEKEQELKLRIARKTEAPRRLPDGQSEAAVAITCNPDESSYCALREVLLLQVRDKPKPVTVDFPTKEVQDLVEARRKNRPLEALSSRWAQKGLYRARLA